MNSCFLQKSIFLLALTLIAISFCQRAIAQSEEEMKVLRMFYKEEELVVTPSRQLKPISQVAENITIITLDEIEAMNAHTLTDVLKNIPGVQMDLRGGPGSGSNAHIQGSEFKHVLLMMDGVTLNNLSEGFADSGAIPVQNIGRIEIIKGPASSSWGSSLGGIINVITKPAGYPEKTRVTLSESDGERNTLDTRLEIIGGAKNLGYYLLAGKLDSDGFFPNTSSDMNNLYMKLRWDLTGKASLFSTFGYNKGSKGCGEFPWYDPSNNYSQGHDFEHLFSTLSINYFITNKADLNLSFRTSRLKMEFFRNKLSNGESWTDAFFPNMRYPYTDNDLTYGGAVKLTWKYGIHNMVFGADFEDGELESGRITGGTHSLEKSAIFVNDTIIFDLSSTAHRFSITPGIRYDHTSTNGDFLSPSLGATYRLAKKTIFRGEVARGFNIPLLSDTFGTSSYFDYVPNPDLKVEKIWSIQAGIESTVLKYIWFKTTLFRHNIQDAIDVEQSPEDPRKYISVNTKKQRRQGFEVEIKTAPVFNTSLLAGYVLIDATEEGLPKYIPETPRYTYDIGIQYNTNNSFKASLKGHYIKWYNDPETLFPGKYKTFIWDMNLMKRIYKSDTIMVEAFFTGHNIFNGAQYRTELCKNPGRWIEIGARFKF